MVRECLCFFQTYLLSGLCGVLLLRISLSTSLSFSSSLFLFDSDSFVSLVRDCVLVLKMSSDGVNGSGGGVGRGVQRMAKTYQPTENDQNRSKSLDNWPIIGSDRKN